MSWGRSGGNLDNFSLVAEFTGPKKVNLCSIIGLFLPQKVTGYLPSY